jgi:hypothetical protein
MTEPKAQGIRATVRAPVRWAAAAAALVAVGSSAMLTASFGATRTMFAIEFLVGLPCAAIGCWLAASFATAAPRALSGCFVSPEGVRSARGRLILPAKDVLGYDVLPGSVVRVYDRRLDTYDIVLSDDVEVGRALRALGVAEGWGAAAYSSQSFFPWGARLGLLALLMAATFKFPVWPTPFLALLAFLLLAGARSTIVVGYDGIHARWLWRRVRIRASDIDSAQPFFGGVAVVAAGKQRLFRMRTDAANSFVARVRGAREALRQAWPAPSDPRLERGRDSFAGWMRRLRGAPGDPSSYRSPASNVVDLKAIVISTECRPLVRVAAAVALFSDEESRQVVSHVARAISEPNLRRALTAAAREGFVEEAVMRKLGL